jgi:hypothetical protein
MMERGWELTKKSWSLVLQKKTLVLLPLFSASFAVLGFAAIFVYHHGRPWWWYPLALAVVYFPISFVGTFCAVAFVAMGRRLLDGEEATLRDGLRCAVERLPQILGWALVASVVGFVVSLLEHLHGGWLVEQVAAWLLDLAWVAASFFAIPILVLERRGPIQTLRRSVGLVRQRWGEGVTGMAAIAGGIVIVLIPATILGIAGYVVKPSSEVTGDLLIALAAVTFAAAIAYSSATNQMFQLVLYRYATEGEVAGPFDVDDFQAAFKTGSRRGLLFWRKP